MKDGKKTKKRAAQCCSNDFYDQKRRPSNDNDHSDANQSLVNLILAKEAGLQQLNKKPKVSVPQSKMNILRGLTKLSTNLSLI